MPCDGTRFLHVTSAWCTLSVIGVPHLVYRVPFVGTRFFGCHFLRVSFCSVYLSSYTSFWCTLHGQFVEYTSSSCIFFWVQIYVSLHVPFIGVGLLLVVAWRLRPVFFRVFFFIFLARWVCVSHCCSTRCVWFVMIYTCIYMVCVFISRFWR